MAIEQMTIDKLMGVLQKLVTPDQVQQTVFRITGQDISSDRLTAFFSMTLPDPGFFLYGVTITRTGDTITVDGQGSSAPFTDMSVHAVFGLNAMNQVTLTVTATRAGGPHWNLVQSFPALGGTLYDCIQFSEVQLVLSTENTDTTRAGLFFLGGLNFSVGTAFTGPLAHLNAFYESAPPLVLSGSITLIDGIPTMSLNAAQEWNWPTQIGYFNLPLSLSLTASLHRDQTTPAQPKVDAGLQFSATLDYEPKGTPVPIVLTATYQTDQPNMAFTADITQLVNTDLPDLVAYLFNKVDVLGQLPANFSLSSSLTQGMLTVLVDLSNKRLASVTLDMVRSDPWNAFGGPVTLEKAHVVLGYDYPTKQPSCDITGTITLGDVLTVDTHLQAPDFTETLTLTPKDASSLNLTALLAHALPEAPHMPDEIPDLMFSSLDITVAPSQGRFELQGTSTLTWNKLPFAFGIAGSATNTLDIALKREPVPPQAPATGSTEAPQSQQHSVSCTLALNCVGPITIVDELTFQSVQFNFDFEQEKKSWSLAGTVVGTAFDTDFTLAASLAQTEAARTVTLTATADTKDITLDLGSGSLTAKNLSIIITKALAAPAADAKPIGVKAQADSAYTWNVSTTGGVTISDVFGSGSHFKSEGTLALWKDDTSAGLSFLPTDAQVAILMKPLEHFTTNLELDRLSIVRSKDDQGNSSWSFDTLIELWFSNVPERVHLPEILPSQDKHAKAHFKVNKDGALLSASQLITIPDFAIPDINFGARTLKLGKAAIEVNKFRVQLGKSLSLSTDFGFGIPQEFNSIFGSDSVDFFNTYQPTPPATDGSETENPTITRFKLSLDSSNGLQVQMLNSPIKAITSQGDNGEYLVDLKDFGAFTFQMPVLGYNGNSFKGSAGFKVVPGRDLKLPLTPLKYLLAACKLQAIADTIPNGLPIKEVKIYDSAKGAFNPDAGNALVSLLGDLTTVLSKELPSYSFSLGDTVEKGLRELDSELNKLPDSFKDYLDIVLPTDFSFDLSISEEGAIQGHLSTGAKRNDPTQTASPIKVLYPTMGPLGPQLNGMTLYSFSIGEMFGGAVLPLTIDMDIDQFTLPTLVSALALTESSQAVLPRSQDIGTKIILNNLFMLLIYETVIPIPVPIFFDQLGLEYLGIEGVNFQNHWSFPNPLETVGMSDVLTVLKDLEQFFTKKDYLLDASTLPKVLPTFTVGPNTLQLPKYMKNATLIDPKDGNFNTVIDNTANVAHLLNALKTLNINEIVRAVPLSKRHGHQQTTFACLELEADWLLTTPDEFRTLDASQQSDARVAAKEIGPMLQVLPATQVQSRTSDLNAQITARQTLLQAQNQQVQSHNAALQMQITSLQAQIAGLQQQIQQARNTIAMLQGRADINAVLQMVAQQQILAQELGMLAALQAALNSLTIAVVPIVNIAADPTLLALRAALQQLPAASTSTGEQGIVLFLKGACSIGSLPVLSAYLGLVGTKAGFSTGMRIFGQITDLLDLEMMGLVIIDSKASPVFRFDGQSSLSLLQHRVFEGDVHVDDQQFSMQGHLSLFPPESLLQISGDGTVQINKQTGFYLNTGVKATLLNFELVNAVITIDPTGIIVKGSWLNSAEATLTLHRQGNDVTLSGNFNFHPQVNATIGPIFDPITHIKVVDQMAFTASASVFFAVTLGTLGFSADVSMSLIWNHYTLSVGQFKITVAPGNIEEFVRDHASTALTNFYKSVSDWVKAGVQGLVNVSSELAPAVEKAKKWTNDVWHATEHWGADTWQNVSVWPAEIAKALKPMYGGDGNRVSITMRLISYGATDTTTGLQAAFSNWSATDIANALNRGGFSSGDIAGVLHNTFHWNLNDTTGYLRNSLGLSGDAAKVALGQAGYAADEISNFFNSIGDWFKHIF